MNLPGSPLMLEVSIEPMYNFLWLAGPGKNVWWWQRWGHTFSSHPHIEPEIDVQVMGSKGAWSHKKELILEIITIEWSAQGEV